MTSSKMKKLHTFARQYRANPLAQVRRPNSGAVAPGKTVFGGVGSAHAATMYDNIEKSKLNSDSPARHIRKKLMWRLSSTVWGSFYSYVFFTFVPF